jgi:hypothetical protein
MGDRVLIQVTEGKRRGPVVYGHWCGCDAPRIVAALCARMASRGPDLDYWSARLVQEVCAASDGDRAGMNLSVGISNQSRALRAADSQGDAGIVIIALQPNGARPVVHCLGGYLTAADFSDSCDAP